MGFTDKIKNAADDAAGKAKEALGDAKGDERLKAEGQGDQTEADLKKAGENAKDAFKK
ncbi:CsbD family protein [Luteipulveratus sp. YIM 133132]|uniref:CsbD family protein n=1 Tax=Luteipulveratus flavus TaxID=3031728 RepID=A0ABT6CBV8_9MICO|nr:MULTISPECIES: CsbD family protein [unclassified Luteipulveratus]MDE9364833.1 CsbD family protein [Luteipulveratus sp. YIM 133132]MDF8265978.1 CsbD family protein [Luteipulveratus sp. YIM 133296]